MMLILQGPDPEGGGDWQDTDGCLFFCGKACCIELFPNRVCMWPPSPGDGYGKIKGEREKNDWNCGGKEMKFLGKTRQFSTCWGPRNNPSDLGGGTESRNVKEMCTITFFSI